MTALRGAIYTERAHHDARGRKVRRRTIQPCGCWQGEVWRKTRDGFRWSLDSVACAVHSGAAAAIHLRLVAKQHGIESLPEHARAFLRDHECRVLAEAAVLDAEILKLTGETPPTVGGSLKAIEHLVPTMLPAPKFARGDRR